MADSEKPNADDTPQDPQPAADDGYPLDAALEAVEAAADQDAGQEEAQKLELDVNVENRGACERHITVTIPRHDVDRYFEKEYSELMPSADVPGFRRGHAPRKLIEARFRKDVTARVKNSLLLDSLTQINEDQGLAAISEPQLDLDAVVIPDEGAFSFEFDLEVRPEFELPRWKGLTLQKPVREITPEDVDWALQNLLADRGRLVPHDGPAEMGDYITTNLTFTHGEQILASANEEVLRIRPVLSFRDGRIEDFGQLMVGATAGETRQAQAELTDDAPNVALRGQRVTAAFEILEVKKLQLPELDKDLLDELGGFELEADLRDAIKDQLQRRLEYEQRRRAREQITAALTVAANWELPPDLLKRQSQRELQRAVLELRRSGFSDDEIQAHANMLRQNSRASTAEALKEHFILERIAEDQEIDVADEDYTQEIALIAAQRGESTRRVRARIEKGEMMDVLRNQILERKVIDLILSEAKFQEVPYQFQATDIEAIDQTAGGQQSDIPEAVAEAAEPAPHGRPAERPIRE